MARKTASKDDVASVSELLRVAPGPVDLGAIDPRATPGFAGKKAAAKAGQLEVGEQLADLQERLYAEGRVGGSRRLLLVLHGVATATDGHLVRNVLAATDPRGVRVQPWPATSGQGPAQEVSERVRAELSPPGSLGVLDGSPYDRLAARRAHGLAAPETLQAHYDQIREIEQELVRDGIHIVKCLLHLSGDEHRRRLLARLDDPATRWTYDRRDADDLQRWEDCQQALAAGIEQTGSEAAPWFVVPADRKWYRDWAVTKLLVEQLESMAPEWPAVEIDPAAERHRLEPERATS